MRLQAEDLRLPNEKRMEQPVESRPDGTQSIERAISLIRIISSRTSIGWGLTALAEAAGLKKATAHRILARLEQEGLVHRKASDQHYIIGPTMVELSVATPGFHELISNSKRAMTTLVRRTGVAALFSLRSGHESVVAALAGAREGKGMLMEVGARRVLMASSSGIAILAGLPPEVHKPIMVENLSSLRRRGGIRIDGSIRVWERAQKLGFAVSIGDTVAGVNSVAVPLRVPDGEAFASITLVGLSHQLPEKHMEKVARLIEQEAATVTSQLDSNGYPFLYID